MAVGLSTLDMLPRFGVPYPLEGLGSISLTVFMFFLSQTLQRHRLLDLHEFLGKIVVVTALGLVLVAIYGGLVSWVGDRPDLFYFNTVVASFVILSLFEPLRERVEEWVVATLFHERYELVRRLDRLRERMANVIDPAGLAQTVLDGVVETRRVTHASLWLLAEDRPGYRLLEHRGPPPVPFLEPGAARALLSTSATGQRAILLENLDRRVAELRALLPPGPGGDQGGRGGRGAPAAVAEELKRLSDAREVMAAMKAGIAIPLLAGDRVVGFLACWDERVPEAFASDEIAAFLALADRCALVIENSKLYQQMKERDRLATLGEMSAGLAHEIRNPLAAIKGAIQYLDPTKLPEEDREFLEIIVDEVNRLNTVVSQFLDYSRPLRPALAPTDVNDVLTRTFKLLQPEVPEGVALSLQLADLAAAGPGRRRAAQAGLPQPGAERLPGHAPRREADRLHLRRPGRPGLLARGRTAHRGGGDPLPRLRRRHPRRRPGVDLRPLLHHQGEGDRPGPRHLPADRPGPPGLDRGPLHPGGGRRVPHRPARPAGGAPVAPRPRSTTTSGPGRGSGAGRVPRPACASGAAGAGPDAVNSQPC